MKGFVVVLGMVGAGKSVQSCKLAESHGWTWLSTGELLRASTDSKIQRALQSGQLLDDETIFSLMETVLDRSKTTGMVILDGFPRRMTQAKWLEEYGHGLNMPVRKVLHLNIDPHIAAIRLAQRNRADDTPDGIAIRNDEYDNEIKPVVDYYRQAGLLTDVDADAPMQDVAERIAQTLSEAGIV